ncbi:MAG: histidine--tRNA ligase [Candidatus Harrisonbacteria bacterium CG10_big_fil_rev_8_21_14_0_10_44_23]|uniref:Histidine--tRNA ligase n=1 Tax=Candidatus Harrisonbacteria bacterium CG10_big_fil_rev_8_21_14_0_10_44_23 TaxID=1974585 RepID=A0A2H0UQ38_9BACT|nr:MAG: histidine--tRNA ligase [Candidatus Harrisonbacteria bacterium CG10_big_fil_rev_8_21_14_0_10_44_23]
MEKNKKTKKPSNKKDSNQSIRGMRDILPKEQPLWEKAYSTYKEVANYYNFQPITTPIVEQLSLYERSNPEADLVSKEMYYVKTRSGKDTLALRPEGTPGVVRAYLEHGMKSWPHPVKLSYYGPFFRHDKPQLGRYRQLHQAGFEVFSSKIDPLYDAQVILAGFRFIEMMKIKNCSIHINTIGTPRCRTTYIQKLKAFFKEKQKLLTVEQKKRLEKNPLRLLDSKDKNIQEMKEEAPTILDHLDSDSKKHFMSVLEYLEDLGLPYTLDHTLVRGLDYYTHTVFEFILDPENEAEDELNFSLGGGGRYDYLVEQFGGKPTPATGVAIGIDRVLDVIKKKEIQVLPKAKEKVFLIHIGDLAKRKSLALIEQLRDAKIPVQEALGKASLAAQLKIADKAGSKTALIFGQKEAYEETVIIRDMKTGAQETVPLAKLASALKKRL